MMFSCCHPRLAEDAQIALVLHILCGFGVSEVAAAFLSSEAAIREANLAREEGAGRIEAAVRPRATSDFRRAPVGRPPRAVSALQRGLPRRIRRIGGAGRAVSRGDAPDGAARRAPAGRDARRRTRWLRSCACTRRVCRRAWTLPGNLSSLFDQDRSRWDRALRRGRAAPARTRRPRAPTLTEYHVEAAIAAVHACAPRARGDRLAQIVALYDTLLTIRPSPVVALNRAIAVAQRDGPERGLQEIQAIAGRDRLAGYPFYFAALGELELRCERRDVARDHFRPPSRSRAARWNGGSWSSARTCADATGATRTVRCGRDPIDRLACLYGTELVPQRWVSFSSSPGVPSTHGMLVRYS